MLMIKPWIRRALLCNTRWNFNAPIDSFLSLSLSLTSSATPCHGSALPTSEFWETHPSVTFKNIGFSLRNNQTKTVILFFSFCCLPHSSFLLFAFLSLYLGCEFVHCVMWGWVILWESELKGRGGEKKKKSASCAWEGLGDWYREVGLLDFEHLGLYLGLILEGFHGYQRKTRGGFTQPERVCSDQCWWDWTSKFLQNLSFF